jgi:hypothetical protein
MSLTDPKQHLATAIRGWIHMDNLTESFTKQASNARSLRNKHEEEAIRLIKTLNLQNSTIKVSGAELRLESKKTSSGLSWTYLEKEIPEWATKSGVTAAQSASLIKWLQTHREIKEVESLKKEKV